MEDLMINLSVLDNEMVKQIHSATLEVLSKTGIVLSHPQAIELLKEHGAKQNGERVTIPEELSEKCLSLIPKSVTLQGRDSTKAIKLRNGTFHAHNVGGVPNLFDPVSFAFVKNY